MFSSSFCLDLKLSICFIICHTLHGFTTIYIELVISCQTNLVQMSTNIFCSPQVFDFFMKIPNDLLTLFQFWYHQVFNKVVVHANNNFLNGFLTLLSLYAIQSTYTILIYNKTKHFNCIHKNVHIISPSSSSSSSLSFSKSS